MFLSGSEVRRVLAGESRRAPAVLVRVRRAGQVDPPHALAAPGAVILVQYDP